MNDFFLCFEYHYEMTQTDLAASKIISCPVTKRAESINYFSPPALSSFLLFFLAHKFFMPKKAKIRE